MRFGRLAGNDWVNTLIYECLDVIDSRDVEKFVRKFRTGNDEQCFHTFRELICGAELFLRDLKPRYEQDLSGLTPDWTVYGEGGTASEILDVVTLHPRYEIQKDIAQAVGSGRIWAGWVSTAPDRLYEKLQDKFGAYAAFAERQRLAFIVTLFTEFMAPVETSEIAHVLNELYGGLFSNYRQVSGVIHFQYSLGAFRFSSIANASAAIQSNVVKRFVSSTR